MINDYEFEQLIDSAVKNYTGNGQVLSSAVGAVMLGRLMGWRFIYLVHNESTVRKYQAALGIQFKDVMLERGKYASKSRGLAIVDALGNFWAVVQHRCKTVSKEDKVFII